MKLALLRQNKILVYIIVGYYFIPEVILIPVSLRNTGCDYTGHDKNSPCPFQQYVQVRKSFSIEHVPSPAYSSPQSSSSGVVSTTSGSAKGRSRTNGNGPIIASASSNHHEEDSGPSYTKEPKLTEEIETYKKQEVYEEKGYRDSAYDHGAYGYQGGSHKEYPGVQQDPSHASQSVNYRKRVPKKKATIKAMDSQDGTSTRILQFAASNLHDKAAHMSGIYAARSGIYCPEVIDFDLNSKSTKMGEGGETGGRGPNPRLKGLGSKIACLKEKYWGKEPLPKQIFLDPIQSKHATIRIPTFEDFYREAKHVLPHATWRT